MRQENKQFQRRLFNLKYSRDQLCESYWRTVDSGYEEAQLKKFKEIAKKSELSFLDWMPYRKELNELGFNDELIIKTVLKHFGKYKDRKDKKNIESYLSWITETVELPKDQKPNVMHEQISGIHGSAKPISEECGRTGLTATGYIKTYGLVEFRVQKKHHIEGSFLDDLLIGRNPKLKKFFRTRRNQEGLGSFYCLNIEKISDAHADFRTSKGEIYNLKFGDLAKCNINELTKNNIENEIADFKKWREPEINMNDSDLNDWIVKRGEISVYDGKGHEPENLIKKYLPTVKEVRQEWNKQILNISKRYQSKKWIEFIEILKESRSI